MDWSYTRNDTLAIQLISRGNPARRGFDAVVALVTALTEAGLGPDEIRTTRIRKYSTENLKQAFDTLQRSSRLSFWLLRQENPEVKANLSFNDDDERVGFFFTADVSLDFFADPDQGVQRSAALRDVLLAWTQHDEPIYGYAHSSGDTTLGTDPLKADPYAKPAVSEPYWLNIYGSGLVEAIGRDRVLATPGVDFLKPLPEGGVLCTTRPSPADFASTEARREQAKFMVHLRPELTYEKELARLMDRTAVLAPVEQKWDADIAPLVEKIVDFLGFTQRQQETAKWNDYEPPPVTEWVPMSEAMPSDVEDERAAIDEYEGLYAEQLIALIDREVPADIRNTPEALPSVDFHFWQHRYPDTFKRSDIDEALIPAIGGYFGRILTRHMGGRWVPRKNLDETQVVVGDRAWFPFLRARHYMRSTQAIVDHSLTQFVRVIEREG